MKLKQPIVFTTYEELKEAVELEVIADYMIELYKPHGYYTTPTIFWRKGDGTITHQSNHTIYEDKDENNVWSEVRYIELLQKSVFWSDIKKEIVKNNFISFRKFLVENDVLDKFLYNSKTENQRCEFPNRYYESFDFITDKDTNSWVVSAFNWKNSNEGYNFWQEVHSKWCDLIDNKNGYKFLFDIENKG
jgi:hypothetical protein